MKTYEEAEKALLDLGGSIWGFVSAPAEAILDAIGFAGIAMDFEASWNSFDHAEKERKRAEAAGLMWASRYEIALKLLDEARALAVHLYNDVEESCLAVNHNYERSSDDPGRCKGCDARAAYEAQGWK